MPRYAKGSLEELVYQQLLDEAADDGISYVNPDRDQPEIVRPVVLPAASDCMKAIKAMCRIHELGWVEDTAAVQIIHNITNGK